jgi:hypothetical protein
VELIDLAVRMRGANLVEPAVDAPTQLLEVSHLQITLVVVCPHETRIPRR